MDRLVIIGNSGSGKSTLAERLARAAPRAVFDLDPVHWQEHGLKRDEAQARALVAGLAAGHGWIIEGVYGWLAEEALPRATALVWTDLPWPECRAGLLRRGLRRGMTGADQEALLAWAEEYWTRTTSSSAAGHERIFTRFSGEKRRLRTRDAVDAFVAASVRA